MASRWYICIFILLLLVSVRAAPGATIDTRVPDVVTVARSQVGVREVGSNCGPEVKQYLSYVGLGCGYAWCAAFVSWCFDQVGFDTPRSAWSPTVAGGGRKIMSKGVYFDEIRLGQVFGLYFTNLGRVGHTGIIDDIRGKNLGTVEGNTNEAGSREGEGVYCKVRRITQVDVITEYEGSTFTKNPPEEPVHLEKISGSFRKELKQESEIKNIQQKRPCCER